MSTVGTQHEAGDLVAGDEGGFDALIDKRLNQPSRRKAPLDESIKLYRQSFSNYNVRHFHQIYRNKGGIEGKVRSYMPTLPAKKVLLM